MLAVAAGAWWMFGAGPQRDADNDNDVDARLTRIETALAAPPQPAPAVDPKAFDDLNHRLAQIESALANPATPITDATLAARLAAVETAVKDIKPAGDQLADLDRRVAAAETAVHAARERADAAAKAAASAIADAQPRAPAQDSTRTDLAALTARVASLEATTKSLADKLAKSTSAPAGAAGDAVAALALRFAVERGTPYAAELAAIDPAVAGKAALDALTPFAQHGVPDAVTLARDLAALLPAARAAAAPPAQDESLLERLHVHVRPIGTPAGDTPDAVLARLETAAAHADLAAALAEIAKLPPPAQAPLAPWTKRVEARNAALAAATALVDKTFAIARQTDRGADHGADQGAAER